MLLLVATAHRAYRAAKLGPAHIRPPTAEGKVDSYGGGCPRCHESRSTADCRDHRSAKLTPRARECARSEAAPWAAHCSTHLGLGGQRLGARILLSAGEVVGGDIQYPGSASVYTDKRRSVLGPKRLPSQAAQRLGGAILVRRCRQHARRVAGSGGGGRGWGGGRRADRDDIRRQHKRRWRIVKCALWLAWHQAGWGLLGGQVWRRLDEARAAGERREALKVACPTRLVASAPTSAATASLLHPSTEFV